MDIDELLLMGEARGLLKEASGLLFERIDATADAKVMMRLTFRLADTLGGVFQIARNNGIKQLPPVTWLKAEQVDRLQASWRAFRESEGNLQIYKSLWFAVNTLQESVDAAYWKARDTVHSR
jgi:hypothetical protein